MGLFKREVGPEQLFEQFSRLNTHPISDRVLAEHEAAEDAITGRDQTGPLAVAYASSIVLIITSE